MADMHA
jgi:hypothetical protein